MAFRKTIGIMLLLGINPEGLEAIADKVDLPKEEEAPRLPEGFVDNDHDGMS